MDLSQGHRVDEVDERSLLFHLGLPVPPLQVPEEQGAPWVSPRGCSHLSLCHPAMTSHIQLTQGPTAFTSKLLLSAFLYFKVLLSSQAPLGMAWDYLCFSSLLSLEGAF